MAIEQKATHALTRLAQFRAHIRNTPLARTERFECTFKLPATLSTFIETLDDPVGKGIKVHAQEYYMSLLCEEVQIPGMVLQNKEVPIGTWNFMRNSNVNFLGNEINITFLTDIDWTLRHLFEAWIAHCVDPTSKQVAYPDDTHGQVWINALSWDGYPDEHEVHTDEEIQKYYETKARDGEEAADQELREVAPGERVTTQWELMEVTPKVLNLIPLASMGTSIARTTLIISSAYWRSRTIDVDLMKSSEVAAEE